MTIMTLTTTINYFFRFCVLLSFLLVSTEIENDYKNVNVSIQDVHCLANAIHHESRGEPVEGQQAVAAVIINRSKLTNKSVCDVISKPKQFSWYEDNPVLLPMEKLVHVWHVAHNAYLGHVKGTFIDITNGATHFATPVVNTKWTRQYTQVYAVGGHVFYKQPK